VAWAAVPTVVLLAMTGALALACFVKVIGIVFLGLPRSKAAAEAREGGNSIVGPMLMLAGACAGAVLACLSGLFLLRYEGLTFLMLTIAISQIAQNLASKLRHWTGGDDGLSGFKVDKILGLASFDLQGRVAFVYCFVVMFISLWLMRRLMARANLRFFHR
jgi:branched-chain amino acid transport system permease protein